MNNITTTMCQYSEPNQDEPASAVARVKAEPNEHCQEIESTYSSSPILCKTPQPNLSPSTFAEFPQPCAHRRWRSTLSSASQEFDASLPTFTAHLSSLHICQKRAHRLARNCTQTRLHPNPASSNSKPVLKVRLGSLLTNIDTVTELHDVYSAALMLYVFPVQAVANDLQVSKVRCRCFECATKGEKWTDEAHTAIEKEACKQLGEIEELSIAFKELEMGMLKAWKTGGTKGLQKMVDALPETKELREMTVVKKYFPRQVREMQEADEGASVGVVCKNGLEEGKQREEEKCDSVCGEDP